MIVLDLEALFFILTGLVVVTQVIVPIFKHDRLFPIFRKSRDGELRRQLADARKDLKEAQLQAELQEATTQAIRQKRQNYEQADRVIRETMSDVFPQNEKNGQERKDGRTKADNMQ